MRKSACCYRVPVAQTLLSVSVDPWHRESAKQTVHHGAPPHPVSTWIFSEPTLPIVSSVARDDGDTDRSVCATYSMR
jgi:hypothetical protein